MANRSRSRIQGIVFDMDGTLIDSLGSTFRSFGAAMAAVGARPHSDTEIKAHFGLGEDKMLKAMLGPALGAKAYEHLKTYVSRNLHELPLHPGILPLLDHLDSEQIPLSVFTGRSWSTTEIILKHHGILDRFVTVVTDDHVKNSKPSPEGLHLALSRMKLAPADILFVGDSLMDLQAAAAAGCTGVAAGWDPLANRVELRSDLQSGSPQFRAEKPEDILKFLE